MGGGVGLILPLLPRERVGVRGAHCVPVSRILRCIPLTLTLSPGGRGDEFPHRNLPA
ncbi:hypothetical protein [Azospirillum palustre]